MPEIAKITSTRGRPSSASVIRRNPSTILRAFQTGFIYQYAFTMIIGVFVLLSLWLLHMK